MNMNKVARAFSSRSKQFVKNKKSMLPDVINFQKMSALFYS